MYLKPFRKWIRRIYATQEEEFDCDAFAETIPRYIDAEVAGEPAELRFPGVKHHMTQCAECSDLYMTLRDVALLEARQSQVEQVGVEHPQV